MFEFIIILILSIVIGCSVARFVAPPGPSQPPFVPTEELANLLKRQPLEDRISYLGLTDIVQLYDNYKMCLTEEELEWLPRIVQEERNMQHQIAHRNTSRRHYDNYSEVSWSRQKPMVYDDDDTYDNFYMQHEEEFKELWGKDDYEDAIDDAWNDHLSEKCSKKR